MKTLYIINIFTFLISFIITMLADNRGRSHTASQPIFNSKVGNPSPIVTISSIVAYYSFILLYTPALLLILKEPEVQYIIAILLFYILLAVSRAFIINNIQTLKDIFTVQTLKNMFISTPSTWERLNKTTT